MTKEYWKATLIRAWHTVWETAAATLPATIVITPAMIEHFDKSVIVAAAAWMATALVAGGLSIVKSLAAGIPEIEEGIQVKVNLDSEDELYDKEVEDETADKAAQK